VPFFYGWVVLAAATVGMAATLPAQTAGVSLFIDAIIADLGLSRTSVSWMYTAATVAGASALPLVGRLLDRFGPRRAATLISLLLALTCVGMGYVGGWITLLMGFLLLRGLGQGALALVNNHAVNLWFERRRGLAIGILGLGIAGATAVFPPLINDMIDLYGWRTTYPIMGAIVAAVMLPLGFLFYRAEPERFGLRPDGTDAPDDISNEAAEGEAASYIEGLTVDEARRTRTFWLITVGGVCTAGLGTGLLFHHFSILGGNGIGRDVAALLFVPLGVLTAGSNLGSGWLMDRFSPRRLLGTLLLVFGAMMAAIPFVTTPALVWAYGVVFGVAQGMQGVVLGSAYAYYFGRAHHGAVRGLATTIFVGGTAIGPPLLALGPDWFGGYAPVLWGLTPFPLSVAAAAFAAEAFDWDAERLIAEAG
jgi:MFS family permease